MFDSQACSAGRARSSADIYSLAHQRLLGERLVYFVPGRATTASTVPLHDQALGFDLSVSGLKILAMVIALRVSLCPPSSHAPARMNALF